MLAFLKAGIKTILFAHSRVKTEVAASYVNADLKNINTKNHHIRVEAYRAGLLPGERREIEKGLRNGEIQGVVSTNALELGIDVGGLDASVVAGFPGSFNSFWQQSGRAGRRGGSSVSVFIANVSPLDQYIMANPDWFFRRPSEEARADPDNPYIYTDHVKCACFELPFKDEALNNKEDPFGSGALDALSYLEEDGVVRHNAGSWYWADRGFPAEALSLRSALSDNVVIVDVSRGRNQVIGEMDRPSAKELLFKNAVYIHRGRQYLVEDLDIENRKALVREADVNYFTDGLVRTDIKVLSEDEESGTGLRAVLGDVLVRSQATKFKKIRFYSNENIGYGDIDLPEEEMQTRALMLVFSPGTAAREVLDAMDPNGAGEALSGAGTLIKKIAPVYLLCDSRDIGISERVRDPHFAAPALYIWDKYPGGTGLAEALAGKLPLLFKTALASLEACPCKDGCPACVGAGANKAATRHLLTALN
jgi:DEAD/DEAH box helicase domain-containing protein